MAVETFQVGVKALIKNSDDRILMVHIPSWSGNAEHWDLPGGRIDEGEQITDTLRRELKEELGIIYKGQPKQLMTFKTSITIPVGNIRLPLLFIVYEVNLPANTKIQLDPESAEDDYKWFKPVEAAKAMQYKFSDEFCAFVTKL